MNEIWKDIPNYEGYYQASSLGRVKSLERHIIYKDGRERTYPSAIIKDRDKQNTARIVTLKKDNKGKTFKVHYLVMLAFVGERPEKYHICHIDGNYKNNNLKNLKYDTISENRIDNYRYGSKVSKGKLSLKEVLEIRDLYTNNIYTQKELVDIYNVNQSCISKIIRRENFSWLNDNGEIKKSKTSITYY